MDRVQGSVTQAPLLDAAGWGEWRGCDAAVACEVVEHVHDPDAFARGLLHALRCDSPPAPPLRACPLLATTLGPRRGC